MMDNWLDKQIKAQVTNGFFFRGRCIEEGEEHITILDVKGQRVRLSKKDVVYLQEVLK